MFGMTFIGGIFEAIFSLAEARMRVFFQAEITGTIVSKVGIVAMVSLK